jgi:hypothetical protein
MDCKRKITLLLLLLVSLACMPGGLIGEQPTGTPSPDASATAEVKAATQTQFVLDAQETVYSESSATAEIRRTATAIARETEVQDRKSARQTATAEVISEATSQAQPFADRVQELYDGGYITKTEGTYHRIDDFDRSWAQLGWYRSLATHFSPTDFVLRADAEWESASDTANWFNSGCGFVFRADEDGDDHYLVYLGLDGYVYMSGYVNDIFRLLGRSYYGKVGVPSGSAEIMLIVEGPQFTFFVNDKRVYTRQDNALKAGEIALTLVSGTNKDFGTRCKMTNIELWDFEE